ncbi:MAG: hypothetical protein ACTS1X_11850 [Parasphingopyxis sp.]|uniref:hypothetical protein n=1 Tax=Parasphingopyxis sp. TaxID=1920299 RepID=UPI003FA10E84
MLFRKTLHAIGTGALAVSLLACGEPDANAADIAADGATGPAEATDSAVAEPVTEDAIATDWSGLDDPATRAAIDERLDTHAGEFGGFNFVVVNAFEQEDDWLAAGLLAQETNGPAIVVSTSQRIIHFAGDEGLAYFEDFRAELAGETAGYFDRGEFVEGIEHALERIDTFDYQ